MDIIEVLPPKNRCYQVTVCPILLVDAPATPGYQLARGTSKTQLSYRLSLFVIGMLAQ